MEFCCFFVEEKDMMCMRQKNCWLFCKKLLGACWLSSVGRGNSNRKDGNNKDGPLICGTALLVYFCEVAIHRGS